MALRSIQATIVGSGAYLPRIECSRFDQHRILAATKKGPEGPKKHPNLRPTTGRSKDQPKQSLTMLAYQL